ncbi:hypothetical protein PDIG_06600 [Penicillium digitatum PHI26]|uniref:Uncharacterized protein n=2 Tax=Penicillium digitatum TaxID=36651 RepID=K9GCN3_PEND2|nr:hypothetical protein PDIP_11250 [Penicillium digitatum Pd1]EKV18887.1 hypothetical protein PDIG_06600 [Penicillium digitatum PHI26]EKV20897.1 hypothetical protein PDIP_11250 [Penicillium digitatum Pd1]
MESVAKTVFWKTHRTSWSSIRNVHTQCIANIRPESESAKVTRNSPLFHHLMMAMEGSMCSLGISVKILEEVVKRVEKSADDSSPPSFSPPTKIARTMVTAKTLSLPKSVTRQATIIHLTKPKILRNMVIS